MADDFRLTSRLPASSRAALEALMFFNVRQHALRDEIASTIERFGIPEIVAQNGRLQILVAGLPDVQCLYAVRGSSEEAEPVGVVVYVRDSIDRLTIVHLSVLPDGSLNLAGGGRIVLHRLLNQIRRVARCTAGIERVELAYRAHRAPRNGGYTALAQGA
jgi:hypothetical protein